MASVTGIDETRPGTLRRPLRRERTGPRPAPALRDLPSTLLLALWFGVISGVLELALVYGRNHASGWSSLGALQISRHFHWMIPLANVLLFLGWGLVVALLGWIWKPIQGRPTVFLLSFPVGLAALLVFPGLYRMAYLALAAALATWVMRLVWAFPAAFRRLVLISLPVLLITTTLFVGWKGMRIALGEQWAIAALPAIQSKGTNVLLMVMDTVCADHLSLHGYGRETSPHLRRIASEGIRFDQAQTTAPWTLPAHASMFTGLWPHDTGVAENQPLEDACVTVAEFLSQRGYLTAGFVANTYFCNSWYGLGRGFAHYEDFYDEDMVVSLSETLWSSSLGRAVMRLSHVNRVGGHRRKTAADINNDFLNWLSGHQGDRPFFVFLNYFDAHSPYLLPEGHDRHFGRKPESPDQVALLEDWENRPKQTLSEDDTTLVADAYDDCIAYLDAQIGKLLDELEARGVLEDTLVVITSDHGEALGEHGLFGHGRSLYSQEVHVPLVIRVPGKAGKGRVVSEAVSLRDLPATFVDVQGLASESPFPGTSLASYWKAATDAGKAQTSPAFSEVALRQKLSKNPNRAPAWRGPMQSVVARGKALIRNADGREELYDVVKDPSELRDLASGADAETFQPLRQALTTARDETRQK